ncbi:MAG: tol-pal system YbgF family protein [Candidatus Scalindua sp.]
MRNIIILSLIVSIFSISNLAWAASCKRCYERIPDGQEFCEACTLNKSRDLSGMKSSEGQIVNTIRSSRESYRNALTELIQFYMDIGYHSRVKKARKELKALNKIPQFKYLSADEDVSDISPTQNIEEANILFQDGKNYKNILNLASRKTKLTYAAARLKKILDEYPESDVADDAAYELADILESHYFKDYEGSVFYYKKSYELNPNTDRPARYMAARVYDMFLHDYKEAIRHYEMALETCRDEELLVIARERLSELKKQGF